MTPEKLRLAIEKAKNLAEAQSEYKSEIFTSILTAELLTDKNEVELNKPSLVNRPISLQELLNEKNPKTDVQKTLIFGYYLETVMGKKTFTKIDIDECYKNAKEQLPPNVSDKLFLNVKNGWIMPVGKTGRQIEYGLTRTGITIVEAGFNNKSER